MCTVQAELLDVITVVVGNKSDLEQERQVAQELAEQVTLELVSGLATSHSSLLPSTYSTCTRSLSLFVQFASQNYNSQYMETSVQSGKNVTKAFHDLAENLIFSHGIFQPGMEV